LSPSSVYMLCIWLLIAVTCLATSVWVTCKFLYWNPSMGHKAKVFFFFRLSYRIQSLRNSHASFLRAWTRCMTCCQGLKIRMASTWSSASCQMPNKWRTQCRYNLDSPLAGVSQIVVSFTSNVGRTYRVSDSVRLQPA
jgi:hypothetical protein